MPPAHCQGPAGQPGPLSQPRRRSEGLLAALQLVLGDRGQRPQLHILQPGLQSVQREGEPACYQQPAAGLGRVERPQHRGQHRRLASGYPVRPGRIRHQDLLQVIDDQQQRPLPSLPGLRTRPGQQIDQHRLDASGRWRTCGSRASISSRAAGLVRTAASTASKMASAP